MTMIFFFYILFAFLDVFMQELQLCSSILMNHRDQMTHVQIHTYSHTDLEFKGKHVCFRINTQMKRSIFSKSALNLGFKNLFFYTTEKLL